MRERWFGATGRKVQQIVLEGTLELEDAAVFDDTSDLAAIRAAHERGTPVVVRCASAHEVHAALSLGEVSCALVRDETLLDLDLPQLTYG